MTPDAPLPEYPRPSLVREEWLNLNGPWEYAIRPEGEAPAAYDGPIVVPYPLESAASGVALPLPAGRVLWYRRRFRVPASYFDRRVVLRFQAVDWEARVFVDGEFVGEHRGGYAPFAFDITDALRTKATGPEVAERELVVAVKDPTERGTQCRGKQSSRPRGILYTSASGIWGTVWLEPVPVARIERVVASLVPGTTVGEGKLLIKAYAIAPQGDASAHRVRALLKADGAVVAQGSGSFAAPGRAAQARLAEVAIELTVPDPRPWSPETPFLYGLDLELDGSDAAQSYAALRRIEVAPGPDGIPRILLNSRSYFVNAVLDQGYWPEGVYTAPSDEALAADVERAKRLGFNAIRKHAKVEPERWYWHCDRLGMLVWQDIPPGGASMRLLYSAVLGIAGARLDDARGRSRFGRSDAAARADFEREAAQIVDALEFFPCIFAWCPFNEGWGQFDAARIAREFALRDPTRIVDHASGWYDRGAGDLSSRHDYSPKPSAPRIEHARAAVLSEYGGLTLRIQDHSGEDARQFGYLRVRDGADLAAKYELLAARLARLTREGLAACVYTQLTDVEIERNGLVTYDRKVFKADPARIAAANAALIACAGACASAGACADAAAEP
ncbi:MAG: glycoside hydrolase family 2 [Spirochaetaceae bacterium]|nr:glycoside hydrolase family 2 [Spirochaetaceae bacterium]